VIPRLAASCCFEVPPPFRSSRQNNLVECGFDGSDLLAAADGTKAAEPRAESGFDELPEPAPVAARLALPLGLLGFIPGCSARAPWRRRGR
jgi:hypothetical protein